MWKVTDRWKKETGARLVISLFAPPPYFKKDTFLKPPLFIFRQVRCHIYDVVFCTQYISILKNSCCRWCYLTRRSEDATEKLLILYKVVWKKCTVRIVEKKNKQINKCVNWVNRG